MNAYWIEYLYPGMSRPVIEDGRRIVYQTYFAVVHPFKIFDGDCICAGDETMTVIHDPDTEDKCKEKTIDECFYIGTVTKDLLEKLTAKSESEHEILEYHRFSEDSVDRDEDKCICRYHRSYLTEEEYEKAKFVMEGYPRRRFREIANGVLISYRYQFANNETCREIEYRIKEGCYQQGCYRGAPQGKIEGELKVCVNEKKDTLTVTMDDRFFESLGMLV